MTTTTTETGTFYWQNNKFACVSRFFVNFSAVVARLRRPLQTVKLGSGT